MVDVLVKLGLSGGIGFFFGILIYLWASPASTEGTAALLLFFTLVGVLVGAIVRWASSFFKKPPPKPNEQPKSKRRIWLPGDKR